MDLLSPVRQASVLMTPLWMTLFYMDASRLEKTRSSARVMFFYFSSAFNNNKLMMDKLDQTGLGHCLTMWLLDYLTNQPLPTLGSTLQRPCRGLFLPSFFSISILQTSLTTQQTAIYRTRAPATVLDNTKKMPNDNDPNKHLFSGDKTPD